jgi:hypothetical protein
MHEVVHDHALQEHGNDSYSDVTLAKDATTPLHDPQHLGHRFLGASVRALEQRVGRGPSGQAGSRSHRRTPTHWALPLAVKRRVADPAQKQSVGHSSTLLREYALGPFAPAMQQVGRVMRGRGSATRPRRRNRAHRGAGLRRPPTWAQYRNVPELRRFRGGHENDN